MNGKIKGNKMYRKSSYKHKKILRRYVEGIYYEKFFTVSR